MLLGQDHGDLLEDGDARLIPLDKGQGACHKCTCLSFAFEASMLACYADVLTRRGPNVDIDRVFFLWRPSHHVNKDVLRTVSQLDDLAGFFEGITGELVDIAGSQPFQCEGRCIQAGAIGAQANNPGDAELSLGAGSSI